MHGKIKSQRIPTDKKTAIYRPWMQKQAYTLMRLLYDNEFCFVFMALIHFLPLSSSSLL